MSFSPFPNLPPNPNIYIYISPPYLQPHLLIKNILCVPARAEDAMESEKTRHCYIYLPIRKIN